MKKIERPVRAAKRRKGLHLTEREVAEVFAGGTFELEPGRDFEGSPATAANHLRDLWRQRHGHITISPDEKNGIVRVDVVPPTAS